MVIGIRTTTLLFICALLVSACSRQDTPVDATPLGEPQLTNIANPINNGNGFGTDSSVPEGITVTGSDAALAFTGRYIAGQTELTWSDTTATGVSAYNLRRSLSPIADFRNGTEIYRGRGNSFLDTSTPLAEAVHYRLFFELRNGDIVPSDSISVRTLTSIDDAAPTAVVNVTAENRGDYLDLRWLNPADTDLRNIEIYRQASSFSSVAGLTPMATVSAPVDYFSDTSVVSGNQYTYGFIAVDALEQRSPLTTLTVTFVDTLAPGTPLQLEARTTASSVQLTWLAPTGESVSNYLIARHTNHYPSFQEASDGSAVVISTPDIFHNDQNLSQIDYYYSVFAQDAQNNASTGATIRARPTTQTYPAAPTGLRTTSGASEGTVNLAWDNASSFADSLVLVVSQLGFRTTLANVPSADRFDLGATVTNTTYTASNQAENYFSLFAIKNGIESAIPAKVKALPADTLPPQGASSFGAVNTDAGVRLDWTLPNDSDISDIIIQWSNTATPTTIADGQRLTKAPANVNAIYHFGTQPNTPYFYRLFTVDSFENADNAVALAANLTTPASSEIETLKNLQAAPADSSVRVSWQPLSDSSLKIYYHASIDPNYLVNNVGATPIILPASQSSFTLSALPNGTQQNFWLATYDNATNIQSTFIQLQVTPQDSLAPLQIQDARAEGYESSVRLTWDEASITDATLVRIRMSSSMAPSNSGQGTKIYDHPPGRIPSFSVEGLATNETYYFSFFTTDSNGNDSLPVTIFARTQDTIAPSMPSNLVLRPGEDEISLYWDKPQESEGVIQTKIVRSLNPIVLSSDGIAFDLPASVRFYSDTTVTNDVTYYYGVYFIDASGNQSLPAFAVGESTDFTAPAVSTNLLAFADDQRIDLQWTNPIDADFTKTIVGYTLGDLPAASVGGLANANEVLTPGNSTSFTGLTNGQLYTFSAFALDANGNYENYATVAATPTATDPAPAPIAFTATASENAIRLDWNNPTTNVVSTSIYRSTVNVADALANGILVSGNTFAPITNTYTDSALINGTTYFYAMYNSNANGDSLALNSSAAPQDATPPASITGLQVTAQDQQITFTWLDPTPAENDLQDIIIRRRLDDFPADINDGVSLAGSPVAKNVQLTVDSGLTNNVIYYYSLFARDTSGLISPRVTIGATPVDTTPPAPVTTVSVINGEGQVTLNWTNPVDTDLQKIVVRRSKTAFPLTQLSDFSAASLDDGGGAIPQTYTDINLDDGDTYYYSLFAVDNRGNASTVAQINAYPVDTTAPVSVFNINATALDQQVDLTWSLPPDPDFDNVLILRRSDTYPTDIADDSATVIYQGSATAFSDTNTLLNDTLYYYRFFSLDVFNNAASADISAMPIDLTAPSLVSCSACVAGDEQVTLTWVNPPEVDTTTIHIRRSTTSYPAALTDGVAVASVALPSNTYNDTGLTNLQNYYYSLFSEDNDGNVSAAFQVPLLTPQDNIAPSPVTALLIADTNLQIGLSWTNPGDDSINIHIRRAVGGYPVNETDGTAVSVVTIVGATSSFTDTAVTAGTTYAYSLFSEDEVGNYSVAAQITATPVDLTPPANVTSLAILGGDYEIDLTWVNPVNTDFNQVRIYRNVGSAPTAIGAYLIATLTGGETTYNNTGLSAYTLYRYLVVSGDTSNNLATGVATNAYTDYATIGDAAVTFTMEKDGGNYFCWTPSSSTHFNHVEVRTQASTPPATQTDGSLIYTGIYGPGAEECYWHVGSANGVAQGYTIFTVEDDAEYTSGTPFSLTSLNSGELELLGPIDFSGPSTGLAVKLDNYANRELVAANNSAIDPQVNLTRIDLDGNWLSNVGVATAPTLYKINDISRYSAYWFGAGSADDGNADLNIWRFTSSANSWYTPTRYDTGAFNDNDEALNILTYGGYYFASGYREVAGVPYPIVWSLDSSGYVRAAFYSGSWTVPTANAQGSVVDHIYTNTGYHLMAIESSLGDSLVSASLTNSTAALNSSFDGDGELTLPDAEVTAISRNYNGETSVSFPIYVSTVTAGGDVKIYAIDTSGAPNATFGGEITLNEVNPIRIESMVKEPDGTLHAIGSVDNGGDNDIIYWRIATDGTIEVTKQFTDGSFGSASFEDQWPVSLILEPATYQPLFLATGYDGGSGYEILFGRIAND